MARALRVDKLTLAALQVTLEIHRAGRAFDEIPVLQQLACSIEVLRTRAEGLLRQLQAKSLWPGVFSLQPVASASGGGALPDITVPSWAIAISSPNPDHVARQLRLGNPAVLARVKEGSTLIDVRTVLSQDEEALLQQILDCPIAQVL